MCKVICGDLNNVICVNKSTMSFIEPEFMQIYKKVAVIIKDKKITATNVMYLVGVVMEIVEKEQSLTSRQKKQMVVDSLKETVRLSTKIPEDSKDSIYGAIDMIAPGAIDLIIAGANGELNINLPAGCGCFGGKKESTTARDIMHKKIRSKK